jgi:hypothetical protein
MINTDLRDEILGALQRGASHNDLLAIVLRHKSRGVSQRETYDTLQRIRDDFGCDEQADEESPLCVALEAIMDRVWGFCPQADAIWGSSLSEAKS